LLGGEGEARPFSQRRHHRACPGDPRPGFATARKTWMAGTSARSKASSPRPAMTTADSRLNCLTATPPRSRGAKRPSFTSRFAHLKHQRAQGMPGARCARSLACKIKKHTSIVTTVTPGSPGIPRAMVLTVSFVLLCPKNLAECANGRLSTNRPSLDLSPFVLKGCEPDGELGTDPVSSSTRTVAWASSPDRARKGVDDGTRRSRCRRH